MLLVKHRLAFEHVQPITAHRPAHCDEHPVAATLWNLDLGGNRGTTAQDVRCVAGIDAEFTR